MQTLNNVHQQFAEFFPGETIKPYAYLLSKKLSEGHICVELTTAADELADSPYRDIHTYAHNQRNVGQEPLIGRKDGPKQPFILHNDKLYLQRYFNYESLILERLASFAGSRRARLNSTSQLLAHGEFIRSLFENNGGTMSGDPLENINWQLVAATTAVLNDFTIITGGPGTGKTTTVAKILAILYAMNPQLKVALAAPTGKAALRLADSLKSASPDLPGETRNQFEKIIPGTIHRLLKYIPDSLYFRHTADNPLNYDLVVVDESSMVDVSLFSKLLDAIGSNTKLILLGDKDQLASVEAGSLFGDLCKSQPRFVVSANRAAMINTLIDGPSAQLPHELISDDNGHILFETIVELKKSHRFISDKGIGKFSKAIIANDLEKLTPFLEAKDEQVTIDTAYSEKIFEDLIKAYSNYIREKDIKTALTKFNEVRVLCAVRDGEQGLYAINKKIEKYLQQRKLIKPTTEFYEHRPVIVTKNYYDLDLFNGDIGIIRPDQDNVLKAWFEDSSGGLKSVLPGFISEAETVYAMTIHKSQGSEYDNVLIVLPDKPEIPILTAELIYTGVTRAKSKVVIQATEAVIVAAVNRRVKRASGIAERFDEAEVKPLIK
ncbi:exodeoxyribonuclease V subunit alpha [Segetibacter sp. 3557_3]|uniref:exodeoxyribonuclease V subunit alpha n=1 Tax=Segetibacter sp. 3557_3 TaxID=2547429 RepID=UPI0010584EF7|nr:exodeoxyribonuclease V subunit alpha [Segetibacter sp. 3557_3]TDH24171.1 exodeoxyribonuclease V subunit alpha [Segetibacter sp. 3557_3]